MSRLLLVILLSLFSVFSRDQVREAGVSEQGQSSPAPGPTNTVSQQQHDTRHKQRKLNMLDSKNNV